MPKLLAVAFILFFSLVGTIHAQEDALAKCLADNTTGKDRKDLARWIFVAMAAHPEMRDLASPTEVVADRASETVGKLVTRLVTENCPEETKAVVKGADSSTAMRHAFERLGRLAVLEIMSNPDVVSAVSKFERYVDRDRLAAVLSPK
jgi:hypothetical protein